MRPVQRDDVRQLAKTWIDRARADALRSGEEPPPAVDGMPDEQRTHLFREAHYWHTLASGMFLEQSAPPRPTEANVRAMRAHLRACCEQLRSMMAARGELLPEGTREQLAAIELRVAGSLDLAEKAGPVWARDADAAWHELMLWARLLDYDPSHSTDAWVPEGWNDFAGLYLA
ncbi:hypothetical protein ABZ953_18985 [Streptomyces sp. NPDC046465]|uniref:hypothetical protein n=1 Tax=Streptomyces sp. NPDC046465 TaxID=3155810 RepID=UPI0033E90DD8